MGYQVSKQALNMVTLSMHSALKDQGIIVVAIAPGHNLTDMGTTRGKLSPQESMPKVKQLIKELTPEKAGQFWHYNGKKLKW